MVDGTLIAPSVWLVTPQPREAGPKPGAPVIGDVDVHFERDDEGRVVAIYEVRRVRYSSPEEAAAAVEAARRRGVVVRGEVKRG